MTESNSMNANAQIRSVDQESIRAVRLLRARSVRGLLFGASGAVLMAALGLIFLSLVYPRLGVSLGDETALDAVNLKASRLTESSGLVFSRRQPSRVWSHNDSGSRPILYCFDQKTGDQTGECILSTRYCVDWEDIAYVDASSKRMIVGDCGDNALLRERVHFLVFPEPNPDAESQLESSEITVLSVKYPDHPVDCEAIWFDSGSNSLMMMGKARFPYVGVYSVSLDGVLSDEMLGRTVQRDARKVTSVAIPMITAPDSDPRSGDIWITTYWNAFRFPKKEGDDVVLQLQRTPVNVKIPSWKQVEAVAVDDQSRVWVTSEGVPAPMGRLAGQLIKNQPSGQ